MANKQNAEAGFAAGQCSVSVSKLLPIIADAQKWADEYIKRERHYRQRGAHREAAHYEDLVSAHQCHAQQLRQLVWSASGRKPTAKGRKEGPMHEPQPSQKPIDVIRAMNPGKWIPSGAEMARLLSKRG